jgi:phage protein D
MLNPAYKLTLGGKLIDTTDEPRASTVVQLRVDVDMSAQAGCARLVLGEVGGVRPQPGDEVKIELGYADNGGLTQVMAGTVEIIEPGLITTRVIVYSGASALLRTFVEQSFEDKTAGEIVSDLAGRSGVDQGNIEDGITFPAYVIDGRRNAYHHMRDLADLCGFDLYFNAAGELVFEKFVGSRQVHVFEYSKHIAGLEAQQVPARAGSVEAWGESPSGSQGEGAWAWLTKDFSGSKGTAGSGPRFLLERAALRTREAARIAASAALTTIQNRSLQGRLLSVGRPEVMLGDAIELRQMPQESLNQTFQVHAIRHQITKLGGFTTRIDFRAMQA